MGCFDCFDGGQREERREEERLASEEARAKAAEAAEKRQFISLPLMHIAHTAVLAFTFFLITSNFRFLISFGSIPGSPNLIALQEKFEQSAAGRAARAQIAAAAKQSANPNKGEPTLKWQMG
ncbi:hypothetical protein RJ640_006872 [Escallonia rubra]|uniref:Uncharacterized protein n=1 Tax=Escallonia rubra TaxID=112253 RepID=A0AA88RA32_9ASTE|nr:hypothetical protein RJ640_006872 [Escallonia rubra]